MKVGNRLKQGTRDQRIQDRHARLVAQVNQLKDDDAGVMHQTVCDDHPGCVIDDRCLHVSMRMDKVLQHMSLSNHNLLQVTPDQMMAMS